MAVTEQLKKLVDEMPDPEPKRGMYTQNIDKEIIEKAVATIARSRNRLAGRQPVVDRVPDHVGQVQIEIPAQCDVHHLHAAADAQQRKLRAREGWCTTRTIRRPPHRVSVR